MRRYMLKSLDKFRKLPRIRPISDMPAASNAAQRPASECHATQNARIMSKQTRPTARLSPSVPAWRRGSSTRNDKPYAENVSLFHKEEDNRTSVLVQIVLPYCSAHVPLQIFLINLGSVCRKLHGLSFATMLALLAISKVDTCTQSDILKRPTGSMACNCLPSRTTVTEKAPWDL